MFAGLIPLIIWLPRGREVFNYWGQYPLFLIKATKMLLCSEGCTAELKYSSMSRCLRNASTLEGIPLLLCSSFEKVRGK